MFAVRIDTKKRNKPKTKRGHVWVKSASHLYYVPLADRGIFETRTDAEHAKTEIWEIIVGVDAKLELRNYEN
jgi:hypothetical protein